MEQVFECLMPYINNNDDLNSVSLVSRRLYELDSLTRKHVTVHVHYAPTPSRLSTRFPNIESLTLKGLAFELTSPSIQVTPWIRELDVSFKRLKELCIRNMFVCNSDIELLARKRGNDLSVLKINKCHGFCEDGLMYVSKYCNHLKTFFVDQYYDDIEDEDDIENDEDNIEKDEDNIEKDGKWLHELAMNNKVIESFHFDDNPFAFDVEGITLLAKNCSKSLVSLKITPCSLIDLRDAFRHAIRLEKIDSAFCVEDMESVDFIFPPNMCRLGILDLPVTSFTSLLPFANQLRELNLRCVSFGVICQCFLFERCPNLEVLYTEDGCGDKGLQVIGQFCKNLRKLTHDGHDARVSHMGLIALAQGCSNLEYLKVSIVDISNEAMECIGTHLKNLRNFCMELVVGNRITDLPLDNGIQAMLMGCSKLERLDIRLCRGGLTDVGMGYIGKYGHKLRYLGLTNAGESDAGLVELSKGCPKLRKLKLECCPFSVEAVSTFVFNIYSLRYVYGCQMDRTKKQAVMVIGIDKKPSKDAFKKIDDVPAVEGFSEALDFGISCLVKC
ncbi:hypothetical protein CTI12_AA078400 [Artemisia annua]|uniref:COI1 F-box domain-containing protein n=1 Tax=Artemisia annua TaxID=35608 RepID=A0A2U1Q3K1_ARTAN|nr:hypothetical protein CTI12_AA078400 [Artemisia annua]